MNATTGSPQKGVWVTLRGGPRGEVVERVRTGPGGRYSFSDLPTGRRRPYALDARYKGGLFAGRAMVLPSDTARAPVITGTLRVWETTTDPGTMLVRREDLFLVPDDGWLTVLHSVTLTNRSRRAYIGRGAGSAGGAVATVAFSLPAGADLSSARILRATLDIPQIVPLEGLGGFGATVAIPPGDSQVTFSYRVEGAAGLYDLSRRALYPVLEHSIHAEDPLVVESDRLAPAGEVTLAETTYRRWSLREPLDAGDPLQASATAQASSAPLAVGVGALLALLAGVGAVVAIRARRRRARAAKDALGTGEGGPRRDETAAVQAREDLLVAIPEPDLRYEGGEIGSDEYSERRARLKDELARSGS